MERSAQTEGLLMNTTTILIITLCVLVMCLGIAALIMLALWPKGQQVGVHPLMIAEAQKAAAKTRAGR